MERVGGGWRTKETNLDEMTCFGGVKSGELGFSVPSPLQHVRLPRPKPWVFFSLLLYKSHRTSTGRKNRQPE